MITIKEVDNVYIINYTKNLGTVGKEYVSYTTRSTVEEVTRLLEEILDERNSKDARY